MDIVGPRGVPFFSLTAAIRERNMSVTEMVKRFVVLLSVPSLWPYFKTSSIITFSAESFFVSMGFERLTSAFWTHSQFERPWQQNEVTSCHSSALDMYREGDFRWTTETLFSLGLIDVIAQSLIFLH